MFSRSLSRLRKTISFRLTVWYSVIFILSSAVLFGLAYVLLSSSLQQKDRAIVRSKLKEYATQYQIGGVDILMREIRLEQPTGRQNSLFVRMADSQNNTVFLSIPDQVQGFDLQQLEKTEIDGNGQWVTLLPSVDEGIWPDEDVLEIASVRLANGSLLQIGKSTEDREEVLERFRDIFAAFIIPVILIGVTGGAFLALRALRPIRGLLDVLRSIIETGRTNGRVPVRHTGDELDELGTLFNNMLERIESLINGMRSSLDNVAHDLRTPMTRLRGTAEMALQSNQNSEACQEALADCLEESEHILTMLNTLMDISEAETGAMKLALEPVNIPVLIDGVVDVYRYVAEDKGIIVQTTAPEELYVVADHNRLRQVLANLLDNAIKYTPSNGRIYIEACLEQQRVVIMVKDTGTGVRPEELPKIWDRLYRGEQSRSQRGLGLGLSLVRAVVYAHKGSVDVLSEPGKGSQFILSLPANAAQID